MTFVLGFLAGAAVALLYRIFGALEDISSVLLEISKSLQKEATK